MSLIYSLLPSQRHDMTIYFLLYLSLIRADDGAYLETSGQNDSQDGPRTVEALLMQVRSLTLTFFAACRVSGEDLQTTKVLFRALTSLIPPPTHVHVLLPLQAQEAHALRFVEASEAEQRAEQLAQQLTEAKRRASIALMEQMAGAREGRVVGRRSLFSSDVPFGLSLGFPCNAPGNPTEAREAVRLQSLEIDIAGLEARLRALRKGISTERIRVPSPVPVGCRHFLFF